MSDEIVSVPPSLRETLTEKAQENREQILEAAGYVPGYSSKIPPSHRDELIRRRRSGEKLKDIAREYGVNKTTVSRAIRARLEELGEYRPAEFMEWQRQRRRDGWEHVRALWDERDSTRQEANARDAERIAESQALAEQMERAERARRRREANRERRYRLHGY